ncbi:hypothetical protein LA303_04955 [Candidatus Sulfidibacterium hydrothermale]|uniref:hypothetical protein n=1 Tax=Candidatus Sulfidibacterium hydrothermale TaxID=2875962 RepID=UPI001F0AD0D2|nr:hypothetical protein [Candidatus Sulfidibacterium hydrothermale]UBM63325.1 hypothetical protein LA303_04955 [Candidatus Sulfidibacterium hydrothermale]
MSKIPSVYAYCDRWCERCAFGARCEAFAADATLRKPENLEADDEKNRVFWKILEETLPETLEYVRRTATEKDADLQDFPGISTRAKFDLFQRKAVNNMVLKAGRKYEDSVDDFLDDRADAGEIAIDELQPGSIFKLVNDHFSEKEKQNANDLISVIMRYQLQLYLKLSRAYYSKGREEESEENVSGPKESDGTAKVCLLLIHRSMVAWRGLQKYFPGKKEDIDEILFLLMRMKNRLEEEFPEAQNFIRPGFDEV